MKDKETLAGELTREAIELNLLIGRTWVRLARIYKQVVDDELWKFSYASFQAWLVRVGDKGLSQAYSMIGIYRDLSETLAESVIEKMTMANARDLTEVPASKRTADDVEAATRLTNNEYRRNLNLAHPGITLEPRTYKSFQFEESQLALVNQAIALAREKNGIGTDGGAMEHICQQFLAAEGEERHARAAQIVTNTVEGMIDPGDLSRPPDSVGWGTILGVVENMAKVFGFKMREISRPGRPEKLSGKQGAMVQ